MRYNRFVENNDKEPNSGLKFMLGGLGCVAALAIGTFLIVFILALLRH